MPDLADLCLVVLVFFYSLNLAPMMFESFTSDRTWASHPPESFHMFVGPHGHKTAHYWKVVSPIALLSFVVSLFLNRHLFEREARYRLRLPCTWQFTRPPWCTSFPSRSG
jgi:hypothetical protein